MYNYCIDYSKTTEAEADLVEYSDLNFRACKITRQSTEKYIFMLNDESVSWSSKHQSTVALSTTEAEYYALSQIIKKVSWLRKLLAGLKIYSFNPPTSILIHVNSNSAIKTGQNPIESDRTKHFDIRYHFVWDEVTSERIHLSYVRTSKNLADSLTKPLPKPAHELFVERLRLKKHWRLRAILFKQLLLRRSLEFHPQLRWELYTV